MRQRDIRGRIYDRTHVGARQKNARVHTVVSIISINLDDYHRARMHIRALSIFEKFGPRSCRRDINARDRVLFVRTMMRY